MKNNEHHISKNIRHFFLLTALAAGTVHVLNRVVDMAAELKNILKSENGNFYDWKNGEIYYTKRGTGSPVLLIHELDPMSSSYEWNRMIKKLEKQHTVYTLDLLGCGRSEKPYLTYTNYLYVQLITDFIQNIIREKTDVITSGNSISFVVLASNMNTNLINRVIAINPPAVGEFNHTPDQTSSIRKFLLESPIVGTFIYNLRTHEKMIERRFASEYFAKPQLVSSKMIDAYFEASHMEHSHGKYLMASIEGNYTDNAIAHALKKMESPLSIITSRGLSNAAANAETYIKQNSHIETASVSNAKLLPQLEIPERLYDVIQMLLTEQ